ncbi:hypothetical protein EV361DRAFT_1021121 [Lentinula raphanica]|nr:hypothetical protein EV361DRAFT_1021121 [Lentinula raphanica]
MSSTIAEVSVYKGKLTSRNWAWLPDELDPDTTLLLLRTIATCFIWNLSTTNYCPDQWQAQHFWHNWMVGKALRDAQEVERFMQICPQWGAAMETHMFWKVVIALIDPHETLYSAHSPVCNDSASISPIKSNPYHHYRNITRYSCFVCQINTPNTIQVFRTGKRIITTPWLNYCTSYEVELQINPAYHVGCIKNEDHELWPNVQATCRSCRAEWLWRKACVANIRDAVGGQQFQVDDWKAKSIIDGFVNLSEGKISDVLLVARDRYWIRTHTKLGDMLSQALAANRYEGLAATAAADPDAEIDLSIEEDEEDDLELAQLIEDGGIRELALDDWARNRILDGFWISPADQWYGHVQSDLPWDVRAIHPCLWTLDGNAMAEQEPEGIEDGKQRTEPGHPSLSTVRGPIPPSQPLCEQTFDAHQKQMRIVLRPAMKNIVRRIVIESNVDAADPAIRASRMTMDDVMKELQEEGTWLNGVDWLERRRNARHDVPAREEATNDNHSTSSGSSKSSDESSTVTGPVLSTSTLQITSSPPPMEETPAETETKNVHRAVDIAVMPVFNSPRLIHPIPHVPVMAAHLPYFSLEAFRMASIILSEELCNNIICERTQAAVTEAAAVAAVAAGVLHRTQVPDDADVHRVDPVREDDNNDEVVEIELEDVEGAGEEIDYLEYDDDDVFDSEEVESRYDIRRRSRSPHRHDRPRYTPSIPISPRKRSCEQIDEERLYRHGDSEDRETNSDIDATTSLTHRRQTGTPPKRLHSVGLPVSKSLSVDDPAQRMLHKRNLEEVDVRDGKRAKIRRLLL